MGDHPPAPTARRRPLVAVALVALVLGIGVLLYVGTGSLGDGERQSDRGAYADRPVGGAPPGTSGYDTLPGGPAPLKVEVLNGSGVAGLAREATQHLREHGFDVVFFGNATRFDHDRSVVLDRAGDIRSAHRVAVAIGIDSVATDLDSRLLLDVTVILGGDWPPIVPEQSGLLERLRRLVMGAER